MGIKILSLHMKMIPHCFPYRMISRSNSKQQPDDHGGKGKGKRKASYKKQGRTIKLLKHDGTVKIYSRPQQVSELMEEFPKYMICPCDSLYIGQKIPSLSEHDKLRLGHNYMLLPKHLFHSVFSFTFFLQCQSCCASNNNSLFRNNCQPFDIQKTADGSLRIRVSEEFIAQLIQVQQQGGSSEDDQSLRPAKNTSLTMSIKRVCTTPQLQKDYQQLVGHRRFWKPKLDTIAERKHKKRKISIKKRKKLNIHSHTAATPP